MCLWQVFLVNKFSNDITIITVGDLDIIGGFQFASRAIMFSSSNYPFYSSTSRDVLARLKSLISLFLGGSSGEM
jgi:hypothetical protein